MALLDPPELRRLRDFLEALPHCPHGCHFSRVYNSPTLRVPTADDTLDDQVGEIIERYGREAAGMLQRHLAEDHRMDVVPKGAGRLLHALLNPPPQSGPPYTHDVTPRPCEECAAAGDPECRDGLLYRDGGPELDYADVYVGRCAHACHRVQPSFTITEVEW